MTCLEVSRYLDSMNSLTPDMSRKIEEHLDSCERCDRELAEMRTDIVELLASYAATANPVDDMILDAALANVSATVLARVHAEMPVVSTIREHLRNNTAPTGWLFDRVTNALRAVVATVAGDFRAGSPLAMEAVMGGTEEIYELPLTAPFFALVPDPDITVALFLRVGGGATRVTAALRPGPRSTDAALEGRRWPIEFEIKLLDPVSRRSLGPPLRLKAGDPLVRATVRITPVADPEVFAPVIEMDVYQAHDTTNEDGHDE